MLEARSVDPLAEPSGRGVLALQHLRHLVRTGAIFAEGGVRDDQVQPNSLDLRLGRRGHRVRCSFLPGAAGVEACLRELDNGVHEFDLEHGAVLEPNVPYLIELAESLSLPPSLSARANPKSSTGRLDMFARVIADTGEAFDEVPAGFSGKLFVHIISRSFPIRLRTGDRLVQLRVALGNPRLSDSETRALHEATPIVLGGDTEVEDGLQFSASLAPSEVGDVIGYRARAHTPLLDFAAVGAHRIEPFWSAISARPRDVLVLEPEAFYVLASHERVYVPPSVCAEMVPFDAKSGELRTHYAGFFDSGFGQGGAGARVVLEIRNRDTPFLLRDRQRIFRFQLHQNLAIPDALYGEGVGSHYQGQGLRLAKQFRGP
jgi:dCTP deaminase